MCAGCAGARLLPVFHAGRPAEKLEDHRQRKNARAVNRAEMRQDMNEDILTHGETMSEEQLLEGLRKTPN